jgi:hypothetical protein
MSFAMLEGKCFCCRKARHKSPTCQSKDTIPKEEWAINKAKAKKSHVNADNQKSSSSTDQESESKSSLGWSGAHVQFYQASEMVKWILCNTDLVENIHTVNDTLTL